MTEKRDTVSLSKKFIHNHEVGGCVWRGELGGVRGMIKKVHMQDDTVLLSKKFIYVPRREGVRG